MWEEQSERHSESIKKKESIVDVLIIAPKYHHHPGAPHEQKIKKNGLLVNFSIKRERLIVALDLWLKLLVISWKGR